ncbi:TonB-dependent receptor plug domain-containing protein [Pedobacter sp. AW1-32]|uniref:TonB-dependent receptor plug domain-containing protein n=1 Tax=Pedobacter sp. AW1-32 TaxID=3383026 RepID=UPI003FEDD6BD
MQKLLLLLGLLICTTHNLFSKSFSKKNEHPITKISILKAFVQFKGVVQDEDGLILHGVTVVLKNTAKKTQTDANGQFTIDAEPGNVLVFSFIGYQTREITLREDKNLKIILKGDNQNLEEVTVTSLGIERQTKTLTYSTQSVKGEELTKAKDPNPMNNLTGKVTGLQINRSSSGMGGSVRVTLRGDKSTRNNQPLYVLDGMPISNTSGSGAIDTFGGQTDRGDFLSTLNPDDIESITVLKGAGASALYGSQGSNGAIQIVTKKGKSGNTRIDFSSNFMIDQAAYLPDIQTSYLQTSAGSEQSWGAAGTSTNQVNDFFQTGSTWINSIALSGGTEKVQNYFSYANTDNKGIMPTNTFKQNTISFRNTMKFFDALTFEGSLMYNNQNIHNRPSSGIYFNPLSGLYLFPRGLDFQQYQDNFEVFMPSRNMMRQNWWNINADEGLSGSDTQQNPYWILNRNATDQQVQNLVGSAKLSYNINDWLTVSARGNI